MTRLYVVVEGQTEEAVVRGILGPHLETWGVWATPIVVTTSRAEGGRKRKGGGTWRHWHEDLLRVLREQGSADAWVTTMFDLYGLPSDFPDRDHVYAEPTAAQKVRRAERSIEEAFAGMVGLLRLIPYVQQHEFEALVLASLDALGEILDDRQDRAGLEALRREVEGTPPENVNHGADTAPSKRLERHIPGYDKVLHGELALTEGSISRLVEACPHFGDWVRRLEALGQ